MQKIEREEKSETYDGKEICCQRTINNESYKVIIILDPCYLL